MRRLCIWFACSLTPHKGAGRSGSISWHVLKYVRMQTEDPIIPRRSFLKIVTGSGVLAALGDLGFLTQLPSVSAAEAALEPRMARFHPEIEPLVCLIEEMPRDRVLEEVTRRVKHGLNYRELLAALLLAGVRNIQPRPVGYKSHAVLVVNSAHLASLASPDTDRWLPIFWAIDQFKASQAANAREGDWTMGAVDESAVPPSDYAKNAFIAAMDNWDESAADAAIVGLARTGGADELFEIFCRYGARDFRDIGHKAIYVQMFATPAECILKDFVEFGDTGCAENEQPPPHQRTHAAEHYAKLINRNGRYRRFRHANSLSKRKPTVLNLMTPRNLPLSRILQGRRKALCPFRCCL